MAIHSSVLAWRIPWTKESGGVHPSGLTESDTAEVTAHQRGSKQARLSGR